MARQKPAKKAKKKPAGRPAIRKTAARRQPQGRPESSRRTKKAAPKTASKAPSKPPRKSATAKAAPRKPTRTAKPVRRPAPLAAKKAVKAVKTVARTPAKAKPQARLLTAVRKLATAAVAAGVSAAFTPKKKPNLDRPRKTVADVHGIPSSLDLDRRASSVKSGRAEMNDKLSKSNSGGAAITAGDVDADWQSAESVGDEAPGGDNPTPDQDRVDDIGRALGVEYADDEELQGGAEIADRDLNRWELDPASKDDFDDEDD
jgi:Family of unknown function (DUF6335)